MKTIFTLLVLAAISANALALYTQVESHPKTKFLAQSTGYYYEEKSPYSGKLYKHCMEVKNKVFLENKNNKKCGDIGNNKQQFCKSNNYCSQSWTCTTRTGTYNEKTAYKYGEYEEIKNVCINKATYNAFTIPPSVSSMANTCTEIQSLMLNPVTSDNFRFTMMKDVDYANLALRMLRAHCEETADKNNLANSDIRCVYDAENDKYRLANNWSAGKWTSKYNSFFNDIWYHCNKNYKSDPTHNGTASWEACRDHLKDLFTATEDYCPKFYDQVTYDSCMEKSVLSGNYCGSKNGIEYNCNSNFKYCMKQINKCVKNLNLPKMFLKYYVKSGFKYKNWTAKQTQCETYGEEPWNYEA